MRAIFSSTLFAAVTVSVAVAVDPRMPLCGCTGGCDALNTAPDFSCTDWAFTYEEFANTTNHTSWYDWATTVPLTVPLPYYVYSPTVNLNCTGGGSDFVVANDTPSGILASVALTQYDAQTCLITYDLSGISSPQKNLYLSLRNVLVGENLTTTTLKLRAIKRYGIGAFTFNVATGLYTLQLNSTCTVFPATFNITDCDGASFVVTQSSTAGVYTFTSNCSLSHNTTTPIFFVGAPGLGTALIGANGTAIAAVDVCKIPGTVICSQEQFAGFVSGMVILGVFVIGAVVQGLASVVPYSGAVIAQVTNPTNPTIKRHVTNIRSQRMQRAQSQKQTQTGTGAVECGDDENDPKKV